MSQNIKELYGHKLSTSDGRIGHVEDLYFDDRARAIEKISVDAGHWFSGREIPVPTASIERICHEDSAVFAKLTKTAIQETVEHHVVTPVT